MIVLGVDTSASCAACAITADKKTVASFTVDGGNTHSVTLLPMIRECCARVGIAPGEIDLFSCAVGPGSFTGVRIAVSTVKGLCAPSSAPCVGVSTMEAMAYPFSVCRGTVVPVINARRGNVYTAVFSADTVSLSCVSEDMIISAEELCARLRSMPAPVIFTGDGTELLREVAVKHDLEVCYPASELLRADAVCALGEREYLSAEDKSIYTAAALAPVYLRPGRVGSAPLQEN